MTLLQVLKQRGPGTDFVRELYAEAENVLPTLSAPQLGKSVPEPAAAGAADT